MRNIFLEMVLMLSNGLIKLSIFSLMKSLFISFTYINENERELAITGKKETLEIISKALKNGGI